MKNAVSVFNLKSAFKSYVFCHSFSWISTDGRQVHKKNVFKRHVCLDPRPKRCLLKLSCCCCCFDLIGNVDYQSNKFLHFFSKILFTDKFFINSCDFIEIVATCYFTKSKLTWNSILSFLTCRCRGRGNCLISLLLWIPPHLLNKFQRIFPWSPKRRGVSIFSVLKELQTWHIINILPDK